MTETTERVDTDSAASTWFDSPQEAESAPPERRAHQAELFTSADLVRSLCRLHDADYLREVVTLLEQELVNSAAISKAA